ncbi:MAG: hypothetical protein AAGH79_02505 [Bacteroidota bacterium]
MKRAHFNNQVVYWGTMSIIGFLFAWNTYVTITLGRLIGLIPIGIQLVLLGLMITKSPYAKISIKIWALIFLVGGSGLQFVGRFLQDLDTNFTAFDLSHYVSKGFIILLGIVMAISIERTVEIVEVEDE